MRKLKFLFKAILHMDYKNMFKVARKCSKKAHKPFIVIFFDIIICGFKYQAGYMDYQEFEFYLLNKNERKTYLTRGINNSLVNKYNNKDYWHFLKDKIEFNNKFKKYLNREFLDLRNSSLEDFIKFTNNKDYIIAKELDNCGGHGISKIKVTKDMNIVYNELLEKKQYLIEEVIKQNKDLNKLYDGSINTLRIFTFYDGKNVNILNTILRIGSNSFVDNFSSGGMYTFVDETGTIYVPAINQNDDKIFNHPVTNTKIVGFKIPNFDKAIDLVKKASLEIKEIKYIGWDIAITDDGASIVEGNEFPGVFQVKPSFSNKHEGILPTYKKYMKF